MQKSNEIEAASSALANQLSAGIPLREAVLRMPKLQPKYSQMWSDAAEAISRGGRLSDQLTDIWPESIVAALKAGEESGKIEEVLKRTTKSMEVSQQVKKIYSKLLSPAIAFLAGVGVFLFFMIGVIPSLQQNLGGGDKNLTFKVAMILHHVFTNYWYFVAAGTAGTIFVVMQWFSKQENKDKLVELANRIPVLGPALRNIYFGMWAYQIALLDSGGIPTKQQLQLSIKTLPACYRAGVERMAEEVEKRGIADSADPDKQHELDPRKEWPFYIAVAFITSHETGRTDQEMQRCAPILIDEGVKLLTKAIAAADIVAKLLAAQMIAIPLLAYFQQMASSLSKAFS